MNELQTKFMKMLENAPEFLAQFVKFVEAFDKLQGQPTPVGSDADGPPTINIGGPAPAITTAGISASDLDALAKNAAEATVKEKALKYVEGFVAAVMFLA